MVFFILSHRQIIVLDCTSSIISKTTSSGLVKLLATQKKGIILSPEVFDILNKLMKSDEENATGDVQLLCKLFSGERCSYHYSTEETRVIPPNIPFSILGSTQLLNAAKLVAKMDHGHGLVDRMLIATPLAYRPTLSEMETAADQLSTELLTTLKSTSLTSTTRLSTCISLSLKTPSCRCGKLSMTLLQRSTQPSNRDKFHRNPKCRSSFLESPQPSMSLITLWNNCSQVLLPHRHQL